MARTLVISNRKGGSGKTSTSVNIAAELAALGQRVLLIDLDTQGHCAVGLGFKPQRSTRPRCMAFLLVGTVCARRWSSRAGPDCI